MENTNKPKFRRPKKTPNTIKVQWGKLKGAQEDIVYVWGDGCPNWDVRLIHGAFEYGYSGFLQELERRGYDLKTLKFSIKKKV